MSRSRTLYHREYYRRNQTRRRESARKRELAKRWCRWLTREVLAELKRPELQLIICGPRRRARPTLMLRRLK